MGKELLIGTVALFGMAVGCSSGGGMGGSTGYGTPSPGPTGTATNTSTCTLASATATTEVTALDFSFEPKCAKVNLGQTVTWTNDGATQHTVTSNSGAPVSFDSGTMNTGQSFSHVFSTAGTYDYHCTFHVSMGMVGTVIVQ